MLGRTPVYGDVNFRAFSLRGFLRREKVANGRMREARSRLRELTTGTAWESAVSRDRPLIRPSDTFSPARTRGGEGSSITELQTDNSRKNAITH
jgi:hypothetical protein